MVSRAEFEKALGDALGRITSLEDETKSLRSESRLLCLSRSRNLAVQMLHFVVQKQPKVLRNRAGKAINFSQLLFSETEDNSNLTLLLANVYSAHTAEEGLKITREWDAFKTKRDIDIHPSSLTNLEADVKASRNMLHRHARMGDPLSRQEIAILDVLDRFEQYRKAKLGNFAPDPARGNPGKKVSALRVQVKDARAGQAGRGGSAGNRPGEAQARGVARSAQKVTVTLSESRPQKRRRGSGGA
jgi:hypothetical protein